MVASVLVFAAAAMEATPAQPPQAAPPMPIVMAPPPARPPHTPAQPLDRATWITSDDFPPQVLRAGQGGRVGYLLNVDATGAVTGCNIMQSSGVAALDAATCQQLMRRAHFVPEHDATGKPVPSTYAGRVAWNAPPALVAAPLPLPRLVAPQPRMPTLIFAPPAPAGNGLNGGAAVQFGGPNPWRPKLTPPPAPRQLGFALIPPLGSDAPAPPVDVAENASPPADPAVRYGRLDNGLRYAIMRRATSVSGVAIRMQINGGSLAESAEQRGYAHLIEHMLFRGSQNVPDGQFAKSLEAMGMTLGRDTTAFTSPETTLFVLDFPYSAAQPTKTGFGLLREAASRATISDAALASERGVVLSERRLRDDPAQRTEEARLGFLLAGQPVPTRWSIGTLQAISGATAASLRQFYEADYRPQNVTLVVVGNIDPAQVEGEIRAAFGDWASGGKAPADIDQGHVQRRSQQLRLAISPGAPPIAEIDWAQDFDRTPDTMARERRILAGQLAQMILNARLARLSDDPQTPFINASVANNQLFHSALVTTLSTIPKQGQTAAALAAALVEQRRLVRYGVTGAEFDRAVTQMRPVLAKMVDNAGTRDISDLAAAILTAMDYHSVFSTPAQTAHDAAGFLASVTPEDVEAAAKRMFAGSGPLIFVAGDTAPVGGEAALRAAIDAAAHQPITAPIAAAAPEWPYTHFGAAGVVTGREYIADLGVTIVRFANGTSLTFKHAGEPKDQILLSLNFGHGLAGLPAGLERSYWQVASPVQPFLAGGLGKVAVADLAGLFAGRRVGVQMAVSDSRIQMVGETTNADLGSQLQLMTAYVVDPGFRPSAFAKAKAYAQGQLAQWDGSASLAEQRDLTVLLSHGDRRWSAMPSAADLATSQPEDLAAILRPALAGPLNLVMMGDVDVERAIAAASATIGALPQRGPRPPAVPQVFPDIPAQPVPAQPIIVTEHGSAEDAVAVAAWPTPGFFPNTADARGLQILAQIIEGRLQDGLREKDGLTYSPSVYTNQSTLFSTYGLLAASVELRPDKTDLFYTTVAAILGDLARTPVSAEELARARAPMLDEGRKRLHITNYWLSELVDAEEDPRVFQTIRSRVPDLMALSPADIQRLARGLAGVTPYRVVFEAAAKP